MRRLVRLAEWTTYGIGAVLLGVSAWAPWAAGRAASSAVAPHAIIDGSERLGARTASPAVLVPALDALAQSDWAPGRVRAYAAAAAGADGARPAGLLRIPRLGIEAAVFDGTDEWALDLGVGRVEGTARLGEPGNVALAGHRDGFFRRLEYVADGDVLEVVSPDGRVDRYVVDSTVVVEPTDVHVLDPTDSPIVTLITCYPFRFVGRAPQRFIVRAALAPPPAPANMPVSFTHSPEGELR
jgi:sortase A